MQAPGAAGGLRGAQPARLSRARRAPAGRRRPTAPVTWSPTSLRRSRPWVRRSIVLVAHDWGGALAWRLAAQRPELIKQLLIINSPHPAAVPARTARQPGAAGGQRLHELPVPTRRRGAAGRAPATRACGRFFGDATWLTPELREQFTAAWGAGLTGPLNYYRASPMQPATGAGNDALHTLVLPDDRVTVRVPTTVLWGEHDQALLPGLLDGLERWVPDAARANACPSASHWIVHEQPALVADRIRRLLPRPERRAAAGASGGRGRASAPCTLAAAEPTIERCFRRLQQAPARASAAAHRGARPRWRRRRHRRRARPRCRSPGHSSCGCTQRPCRNMRTQSPGLQLLQPGSGHRWRAGGERRGSASRSAGTVSSCCTSSVPCIVDGDACPSMSVSSSFCRRRSGWLAAESRRARRLRR